jgi:hypothetical protein
MSPHRNRKQRSASKKGAERAANRATNHAPKSTDKKDPGLLPPFTVPPRLEESASTKRTRGRTLYFVALHKHCK